MARKAGSNTFEVSVDCCFLIWVEEMDKVGPARYGQHVSLRHSSRYSTDMEIRPAVASDLTALLEIDGTIESSHYLHVERTGEGLARQWRCEQRPLRHKRVERNRPSEDDQFLLKQIVTGADDGVALLAEHEGAKVALLFAQVQIPFRTMRVIDLRVDFDYRRQGLASAMLFQTIAKAREQELRAVTLECRTDNLPACDLFARLGFELAGLDTHRHSNHDLVKESATLIWYAAFD